MNNISRSDVALAIAIALLFGWLYTKANTAAEQAQVASRFLEDMAFNDAVAACEAAEFAVPFRYCSGKSKWVVGLVQQKNRADASIMPYLQLYADGLYCNYSPIVKQALISDGD